VSPTFTGDPKAPTPTAGDNDTSIATTAFVATAVTGLIKTVKTQKFTASGTYTPSAGMTFCVIECVGGGGGGGGCGGGASQSYTGGGGGSGGYSRLTALAATIGASKAVTIGAAGTGGGAGANNGTIGGDTSVGALCIGKAGLGGICGSSALVPSGGDGGPPGTGDIAAAGMPGNPGFYNTANAAATITASGAGGSSFFGGGAVGIWGGTSSAGNAARAYGSGGSGGSVSGANNAAGGNGSAGFVHITEYCTQ
jgi:hypothetical protein